MRPLARRRVGATGRCASYTAGMKAKYLDPLHFDVLEVAKRAESTAGEWPLLQLERLADLAMLSQDGIDTAVRWQATGELRPVLGGEAEVWLRLQADAVVPLCCQRCLGPVHETIALDRWIRFVADEAQAEALDAELEDDVLVLKRDLDLRELVEDELLLALPLVPRHEVCPEPLPMEAAADEAQEPAPHPFAALAGLKRKSE